MTKVIVLMSVRAEDWREYAEDASNGRLADDPGERYACLAMFRSTRNAGVAYSDMLDLIGKNADIPMLVQTSQDAVALALRTAVARGLVRAKDARVVFFDGNGKRHVIRIEDVPGADGTRTIDFSAHLSETARWAALAISFAPRWSQGVLPPPMLPRR